MTGHEWANWAGNQRDTATQLRPGSADEVAAAVNECPAPTGFSVRPSARACLTAAATSSAEPGRSSAAVSR